MKIVLVFAAFVALAASAPSAASPPIAILQYDENRDDFGQFALSFLTADGTKITRQGELKPTADGKDHVLIQSGSTSYTSSDGRQITETWSADEEGYKVAGDHLPVAPEVPAAPAAPAA